MPSLDEQIEHKLNEELQKVKDKLITYNSTENLNEKVEKLEEEIEKLKEKNKSKCGNSGNKCMPCNLCSFSLF